jgi:hypothetical protein
MHTYSDAGTFSAVLTVSDGTDTASDSVTIVVGGAWLNFNDYTIETYGGSSQDKDGTVTIEDGGTTLRLVGNTWKKIALPTTVAQDTVLEFDFSSSVRGEIHGIGFDTDNGISAGTTFELYGTQKWGIQTYRDYSGTDWKRYTIPVGEHFTGEFLYLIFVMDHDVSNPTGESVFSRVEVKEQ